MKSRSVRARVRAGAVASALLGGGCASIGSQDAAYRESIDFGPPREIRVCVLKAPGVSDHRAARLVAAINADLAPFALTITVPWTRPWQRPGFTERTIIRGVAAVPLEPPCDRLLALVDRHVGDALWGLPLLPEIVGSVETASATRGYVVANHATLTQLWVSPTEVAVHEFYHMLGCPHAKSRVLCYRRIAALKREADDGFFPAMTLDGRLIAARAEANLRVAAWLDGREGPVAASQIPALGESR